MKEKVLCRNCGHEIGEFSKNKKDWFWKHIGRLPDGGIFYADKACLKDNCRKPEPKETKQ